MSQSIKVTTLVADIGGTHSRFAIAQHLNHPEQEFAVLIEQLTILPTAGFQSLEAAIACYLKKIAYTPETAVIAVAAPVTGNYVKFSNRDWESCTETLQQELGLTQVLLLNDFAAIAHAIPHLNNDHLLQIGPGQKVVNAPMVALGPGTGLGVSALIQTGAGWKVVPSEAGHIGFAPCDALEIDILEILQQQYARISVERLLSGPGLVSIYNAICIIEHCHPLSLAPNSISEYALTGKNPQCVKALDVFCATLGSFAGDIAMTFCATGGVHLAGGILPKIQNFLLHSRFRERFEDKARVGFIKQIPTYQITEQQPALIGAAAWGKQNSPRQ